MGLSRIVAIRVDICCVSAACMSKFIYRFKAQFVRFLVDVECFHNSPSAVLFSFRKKSWKRMKFASFCLTRSNSGIPLLKLSAIWTLRTGLSRLRNPLSEVGSRSSVLESSPSKMNQVVAASRRSVMMN